MGEAADVGAAGGGRRVRRVAFLRGINLGRRRVTMDRLRALFAELGFGDVTSFVASGNVAFEAAAADNEATLRERIEAHLRASLGYDVETFLRTPAEIAAVVAAIDADDVFQADDVTAPGHAVQIGFLRDAVTAADGRTVAGFSTDRDVLRVRGRELFWLCRGRMSDNTVDWKSLDRAAPMRSTVRNLNTVRKIAARYPAG
jgi:uncharacterized protein (DUF1697 family)